MKVKKHIIPILLMIFMSGCSDFLEDYSQDTYYIKSYEDLDELLIGDCYLPVNATAALANTQNPGYFIHFLADEIEEQNGSFNVSYDDRERIFGYYTWQQRVGETDSHSGYLEENSSWTEIYRLINVANNIIESVKSVPQNLESEKLGAMRVRGEAHFLRAAYYFWLVNLYGKPYRQTTADTDLGVPIKTTSKVEDIIYQRNTVQECYDQILSDLKQAEQDLAQTGQAKSIYRADITVVQFLLSRVFLYMQNWDEAIYYADKVLETHNQLINMNALDGGFLTKSSVENVFSMGGAEIYAALCNNYKSFRVSHELYNSYADDDLRKSMWWWVYDDFVGYAKIPSFGSTYATNPNSADYYYYNYSVKGQLSPISDKFLFRTAEMYLTKAEAEAYKGNEREAREAVNTLRLNRYKTGTAYEITATGNELITVIREERYKELALEGHRWFDLRRYSVCEKEPYSKKITHDYTYYNNDYYPVMTERHRFVLEEYDPAYTLPIPHEVLEYNSGMINNERPMRSYTVEPIS